MITTDEAGVPRELYGSIQDITDRHEAEMAMKESEERCRLALEAADLGSWRHDFVANAVYLDPTAQALLGFDCDVVTNEEVVERFHPDDFQKIWNQAQEAIETGSNESHASEFRLLLPNGEMRWISLRWRFGFLSGGSTAVPKMSIGTYLDITERKQNEEDRERLLKEVVASREQLKAMSRRAIDAQESERRHLALELHDEIGQVLTTVNMSLESLRSRIDPAYVGRLEDGVRVVNQAIDNVRELSLNLRPASLDLLGLEAALRAFVQRQGDRAGLLVRMESTLDGRRLSSTLETVCFRIVQESLTNIIRHAEATHCWIKLELGRDEISIEVRDDGQGFDASDAHAQALCGKGLGLLGMRERVQFFGGQLDVHSTRGSGTTIDARLPLELMQSPAVTDIQR
jgi:two-component system sensor histidine kinase UhpB